MESILHQWIYVFGPPGRLVLDETGAECERLNVERCPRGTTSGQGASQHTGTGLVERHVALTKHTMNKLHAELIRQGLQPEAQEIAREAAMAQNITLNYNGSTPCMAVFGVLPRGFYNIENDGAMARGATQTDLTVFERAMRIRQAALAQVHQAVAETRVARAAKSRPHQLEVSQLAPGTSEVEFHRDLPGDPGWRGPALLLRVDTDEGTAVIQYQGRPYLVGLRHIRPFKGIFMVEIPDNDTESALHRLMRYTENLASYKIYYYGWLLRKNGRWVHVPRLNPNIQDLLDRAQQVAKSLSKKTLNGIMLGKGLRSFKPPSNTTGILVTWISGGRQYAVETYESHNHLKIKKVSNYAREDLCLIYFYFYNPLPSEEVSISKTMDIDQNMEDRDSQATASTLPQQQTQTAVGSAAGEATAMDLDPRQGIKRGEPGTPTSPPSPSNTPAEKKSRTNLVQVRSDLDYLVQVSYLINRQHLIDTGFPEQWRTQYDISKESMKTSSHHFIEHHKKSLPILFTLPSKRKTDAGACLRTAKIYKVDTETNNIEEKDLTADLWPLIEAADLSELKQFVEEKALTHSP